MTRLDYIFVKGMAKPGRYTARNYEDCHEMPTGHRPTAA